MRAQVVAKLKATKVHRVFVTDEASGFKPLSVIAITDLLCYMLNVHKPGVKVKVNANN